MNKYPPNKKQAVAHPAPLADLNGIMAAPCPDEVSRMAYFTYVNEGCPEGRHVQHWLDAEAELIRERGLTRTHAFHTHA